MHKDGKVRVKRYNTKPSAREKFFSLPGRINRAIRATAGGSNPLEQQTKAVARRSPFLKSGNQKITSRWTVHPTRYFPE